MTSTIKADVIEAATGTNTDLTLQGKGTGVVNLSAGSKLGGTALTSAFLSPTSDLSGLTGVGATAAEKINIMLNSFRIEEQGGLTVQGMVDGVSDVFTDQSGVDTDTSTDETYNATYDYYENAGGYTVDQCEGGTATGSTEYTPAALAFNNSALANNNWYNYPSTLPAWLQYEFTAPKTIAKYTLTNDWEGPYRMPTVWVFQGYNGTTWDDLDTVSSGQTWTGTQTREFLVDAPAEYTIYRLYITDTTGTYDDYVMVSEMEMMEAITPNNSVIVSDTFTALSQPDTAFVTVWHEDVAACTPNTDFTVEASRDAGTTWTVGTLALAATLDAAEILTCSIDISAQPAGTSMRWRVKFFNTLSQRLRGVGLQWS
jgi:hypothetical protein